MGLTRIPLTIVATANGARTEGVLVGVMADHLDALESERPLDLDEHDWEVLVAICEFYDDEANVHSHAGRALCRRIIDAAPTVLVEFAHGVQEQDV